MRLTTVTETVKMKSLQKVKYYSSSITCVKEIKTYSVDQCEVKL